jgi:hypothetical protein
MGINAYIQHAHGECAWHLQHAQGLPPSAYLY